MYYTTNFTLWHTDDVKLHKVSELRQNVQVQHSDIPRLWRGLSVSCWTKLVRSWRRVFVTLSVVIIRQPAIMLPAKPSSTPVSTGCDSILSLQAGCRPLKLYHQLPSYWTSTIEAFLYFISKSVCFAQYHGTMEFTLNIKCQLIHYFIGLTMSPNVKSCQIEIHIYSWKYESHNSQKQ